MFVDHHPAAVELIAAYRAYVEVVSRVPAHELAQRLAIASARVARAEGEFDALERSTLPRGTVRVLTVGDLRDAAEDDRAWLPVCGAVLACDPAGARAIASLLGCPDVVVVPRPAPVALPVDTAQPSLFGDAR